MALISVLVYISTVEIPSVRYLQQAVCQELDADDLVKRVQRLG